MKENQIKVEKQLINLAETVNFVSEKFHELEADWKLKEEIIKRLRGQVSVLDDDLKKAESKVDQQAQYSRRNCLLFHGIKEENVKTHLINIIWLINNMVKDEMDIETSPNFMG